MPPTNLKQHSFEGYIRNINNYKILIDKKNVFSQVLNDFLKITFEQYELYAMSS